MSDEEATARSALLDAIAASADQTGMRCGPAADALLDALVATIRDPATAWAFRGLLPQST